MSVYYKRVIISDCSLIVSPVAVAPVPLRVQVCGHELMAHRAVLACCSPYLFEIFSSNIEPHGVSHVTFEDLNPEAVEVLLNYAYTAQ